MQTYWCVSINSTPLEELYQILLVLSPAYLPSARCFYEDPAARHVWSLVHGHQMDWIIANGSRELPDFGRCGFWIQKKKSWQGLLALCCSGRILSLRASYALQKHFCSRKCRFCINAGLISLIIFYFWKHIDLATDSVFIWTAVWEGSPRDQSRVGPTLLTAWRYRGAVTLCQRLAASEGGKAAPRDTPPEVIPSPVKWLQ